MNNIVNAANTERREFLANLLSSGNSERDSILEEEINNVSEVNMLRAYEAAVYGNASNRKVIYLLGGNDPGKCPF